MRRPANFTRRGFGICGRDALPNLVVLDKTTGRVLVRMADVTAEFLVPSAHRASASSSSSSAAAAAAIPFDGCAVLRGKETSTDLWTRVKAEARAHQQRNPAPVTGPLAAYLTFC